MLANDIHPMTSSTLARTAATDHAVDAINNLPHLPRLVLLFVYCEGMSMTEIGRVLGVDQSRVRTMHDEALRQLQLDQVG